MNFYLIGVDYRSAPLEIRELIYRKRKEIAAFWAGLPCVESAILTTCNRFDIYFSAPLDKQHNYLKLFKERFPEFYNYSYLKIQANDIFRYALRLACGLESQLKGEFQILDQLKNWTKQDLIPPRIFRFWSQVIKAAEQIRNQSGLGHKQVNIAKILFEDLFKHSVKGEKKEILVLGTGNIARLIAEYKPEAVNLTFVAHKNRLKAEILANYFSAKILSYAQLPLAILDADVLISATSSPHLMLTGKNVAQVIGKRKRPLYIYDLGFPCNIAPQLGVLSNVVLRNFNDLSANFKHAAIEISKDLDLTEYLIEEEVKKDEIVKNWYSLQPVSY